MNGQVFQTFVESNDQKQFTRTIESLGRWASVMLKQSGDLLPIYRELQNLTINEPEMLSDDDDAANPAAKFHK